jgi:mycothiol system anti-sigma-R factor
MNCQEALNLLYDIIDKEASEVDEREVRKHFEQCRDCYEKFRLEESIHNFLREKVKGEDPGPAHQTLKQKIMGRLDDLDGAEEPESSGKSERTHRPFRLPAIALVAAASVVVLLGAAFLGTQLGSHESHFIPLEQAHWAMADSPTGAFDEMATQSLLATAVDRYRYNLDPLVGDYRLLGGRAERLIDAEMLHYIYVNGESRVSVFLAPAGWFDRFANLNMEQAVRNNIQFFNHNCRGCRLVFHRDGGAVIITASADRNVDLLRFVPGHSTI